MRPENLADSIAQSRPTAVNAFPEVSWVLMQQAGVNCFCHVIADRKVSECRAVILSVSGSTLPERSIGIGELRLACKYRCQYESATIESIFRCNLELVAGG